MADQFVLSGGYTITPLGGVPSLDPNIDAPIDESLVLGKKYVDTIRLTSDVAVDVEFGGVSNAHLVILKAIGGKVRARITSADGSQQSIPFDSYLILMSMQVPITAIDLLRYPATQIEVRVTLGERA